jgi:hypothetical protein
MAHDWHTFKDSFERFVVQDLKKSLKANVEVGVIILTTIGIDCLSGYFTGKESDGDTFKKFIDRFMPNYSPHAVTLYKCVRNGLAHKYIIKEYEQKSFLFTRNKAEKHLVPVEHKQGWFYLNREQFALDFIEAQNDFFQRVEVDKELQETAMRRLRSKGFLGVFSFHEDVAFVDSDVDMDEYNGVTGTFTKRYL